jgi:hypothetical protein
LFLEDLKMHDSLLLLLYCIVSIHWLVLVVPVDDLRDMHLPWRTRQGKGKSKKKALRRAKHQRGDPINGRIQQEQATTTTRISRQNRVFVLFIQPRMNIILAEDRITACKIDIT